MKDQSTSKEMSLAEANAASMKAVRENSAKLNKAVARLWVGDC